MNAFVATFAFFFYAALNGITFTLILAFFNWERLPQPLWLLLVCLERVRFLAM